MTQQPKKFREELEKKIIPIIESRNCKKAVVEILKLISGELRRWQEELQEGKSLGVRTEEQIEAESYNRALEEVGKALEEVRKALGLDKAKQD